MKHYVVVWYDGDFHGFTEIAAPPGFSILGKTSKDFGLADTVDLIAIVESAGPNASVITFGVG